MQVVVVESPAKAKTINKYLGKDYQVLASYGHVRDLPSKDGSVLPDDDFAMSWEVDSKSQKRLKDIADALKDADGLVLATDPDREGEAISWHVLEVLAKKRALKDKDVKRVVFNAITKSAVTEAMASPRDVDMELVDAYLARRALDYLVGFTLSPVLWRKLPGARSAGRVQSVALRLVTEREMEIEAFKPQEYWSVEADVTADGSSRFPTKLVTLGGKKLQKLSIKTQAEAEAAKAAIAAATLAVAKVESKPTKRHPSPPFTTSTLQQEAARKLGFDAKRTMQAAQKLYEGVDVGGDTVGLITYMRTDGVQMAGEAIAGSRRVIEEQFGKDYLPDVPRAYSSKARNAQEAHEAIRPTSFSRRPGRLPLSGDLARLYELIWKRALASQMESARLQRTTIDIASQDSQIMLRAVGSVITFDGFLTLYMEGQDDTQEEGEARLPAVPEGVPAQAEKISADQHFTQPPPRYTEASLVKKLEELGIGRPSTYASILSVLRERDYVRMEQKRFVPESKGRLVTAFLESFFSRYVQYDFTASLEEKLDRVSAGELSWKALLREFWDEFFAAVSEIGELRITEVLDTLNESLGPHIFTEREDGKDPRQCPLCDTGRLSLKTGRYGAFIGCSNYPECRYTRQLGESAEDAEKKAEAEGPLGQHPDTGLDIFLKSGRFGPYLEMAVDGEDKPKRSSLPKGWAAGDVTLDKALQLLALPRDVGPHPDDGDMITAGLGRYGPFVKHKSTYANVSSIEEVFEVGLNRAVAMIEDKKANPGRGRAPAAKPLKELGEHPETGKLIAVYSGRYGPYVKHDKTNATLPKGMEAEAITLDQAVVLIAEKDARGSKKKTATKKAAGKGSTKSGKSATAKSSSKSKSQSAGVKKPANKTSKTKAKDKEDAGATE